MLSWCDLFFLHFSDSLSLLAIIFYFIRVFLLFYSLQSSSRDQQFPLGLISTRDRLTIILCNRMYKHFVEPPVLFIR